MSEKLMLLFVVLAQPTELTLEVSDPSANSQSVQTQIDAGREIRDIPLPLGASLELSCNPNSPWTHDPWSYMNSSGLYEPVFVTNGLVANLSVFAYEGTQASWKLRVVNFNYNIAGVYRCENGDVNQTINLYESKSELRSDSNGCNYYYFNRFQVILVLLLNLLSL